MPLEFEQELVLRTYAWSRLTFHANQRLSILKTVLFMSAAFSVGIVLLLNNGAGPWLVAPLGAVLAILGILFCLLDRDCHARVRSAEAALRMLEVGEDLPDSADGAPHPLKILGSAEFKKKGPGAAACCDGFNILGCVYMLIVLEGLYLAALPFFFPKQTPPPVAVAAPANLPRSPIPRLTQGTQTSPSQPNAVPPRPNLPVNVPYAQPGAGSPRGS